MFQISEKGGKTGGEPEDVEKNDPQSFVLMLMGEDKTVTSDCGRKQQGQLFVRSGEGQMGKTKKNEVNEGGHPAPFLVARKDEKHSKNYTSPI